MNYQKNLDASNNKIRIYYHKEFRLNIENNNAISIHFSGQISIA